MHAQGYTVREYAGKHTQDDDRLAWQQRILSVERPSRHPLLVLGASVAVMRPTGRHAASEARGAHLPDPTVTEPGLSLGSSGAGPDRPCRHGGPPVREVRGRADESIVRAKRTTWRGRTTPPRETMTRMELDWRSLGGSGSGAGRSEPSDRTKTTAQVVISRR